MSNPDDLRDIRAELWSLKIMVAASLALISIFVIALCLTSTTRQIQATRQEHSTFIADCMRGGIEHRPDLEETTVRARCWAALVEYDKALH